MALTINFGIPTKGISGVSSSVKYPAIFFSPEHFFLNQAAMDELKITFKSKDRSSVALLYIEESDTIVLINSTRAKLPKVSKNIIYKNGKFSNGNVHSVLSAVLELEAESGKEKDIHIRLNKTDKYDKAMYLDI